MQLRMKLTYRQKKYRALFVSFWIALTVGVYFSYMKNRNATVNMSEIDTKEVKTATENTASNHKESVATGKSKEMHSNEDESSLANRQDGTTNVSKENFRKLLNAKMHRPETENKLSQSIPKKVLPAPSNSTLSTESKIDSKLKLIASTSIGKNAKASGVKPILKQHSNLPTMESKPTPNSDRTLDPMDEYTDMGGIGPMNESGSVIINPHPFNFTLNPADVCDVSEPIFLLIYIHTRPENIRYRQLIRTTWGNTNAYNVTLRRIFVIGSLKNAQTQEAIDMESNLHKDILQENFIDSYRNMTYKALGALKWVANYCRHATFIMKTDDDIYINMPLLIKILAMHHATGKVRSKTIFCNAWHDEVVPRKGKWAVTLKQRKHPTWPTFCQGLSYVMTPDLPAALYNVSFQMPFLWMDDVYVTGFLARRVGVIHIQLTDFYVVEGVFRKFFNSTTKWQSVIFSHVKDLDFNRWAWQKLSQSQGQNDALRTNTTASVQRKKVSSWRKIEIQTLITRFFRSRTSAPPGDW